MRIDVAMRLRQPSRIRLRRLAECGHAFGGQVDFQPPDGVIGNINNHEYNTISGDSITFPRKPGQLVKHKTTNGLKLAVRGQLQGPGAR